MVRLFASLLLILFVAGCQTGANTDETLKSAAVAEGENAAGAGEGTVDTPADETEAKTQAESESEPTVTEAPKEPKPEAKPTPKEPASTQSSSDDPIAAGAARIAKLRKSKGERVAVEAVFACYKKARERSASLQAAQICAAQDFALSRDIISRRKPNATGTGDRALLVSKRHAARIGALMQLKGMGQSQFNTFGKYLHAVAEPAYKKAIAS